MEKLGSSLETSGKACVVETHLLGLPIPMHCELDRKCVVHPSVCGRRAFGALVEPFLPR